MDLQQRAFLREIGLRVRQRRERRKWSQADLGRHSGPHRTFVGHVERGERNVSILNLRAIPRALRVPLAELVAEEGEQQG